MNNIFNFAVANLDIIIFANIFILAIVFLWLRGGKSVVFKMLYALVTEAEKEYGNGTGALKLASVIEKIYSKLPTVVKLFVTANTLEHWVDKVLEEAKKTWEQNNDIRKYINPENDDTEIEK